MIRIFLIHIFLIFSCYQPTFSQEPDFLTNSESIDECTIGVANGSATTDGRPILWKSRDWLLSQDNEVKYNINHRYKFICLSNAGSSSYAWAGVNEHGFAILNSHSGDIPNGDSGLSPGALMRNVLGMCKTVADFIHFLDSTNITGRKTSDNFAVIDSTGEAVIFETADTTYWKFDTKDTENGYLIRTNFTLTGSGVSGMERHIRSSELVENLYIKNSLNHKSIIRSHMRDFSDKDSNPINIPYTQVWQDDKPIGYININWSICSHNTVSGVVIQGIKDNEKAGLSTMWTLLGNPATTVALPYWPLGNTPELADGEISSKLCDQSISIQNSVFDTINMQFLNTLMLRDYDGGGLWPCLDIIEDNIFENTESILAKQRLLSNPDTNLLLISEVNFSEYAHKSLWSCFESLNVGLNNSTLIKVYPNPAYDNLSITYKLIEESFVRIEIFSHKGELIKRIESSMQDEGCYSYNHNITNYHDGIYLVRVLINGQSDTFKILKI